jgi:hypothetical protein
MFETAAHEPTRDSLFTHLNHSHSNGFEPLSAFAQRLEIDYPLMALSTEK